MSLTDSGVDKAERAFKVENLFDFPNNTSLVHFITQALKANYIMRADIEYMVDKENDVVLIIDQNTGRTMQEENILTVYTKPLKRKKALVLNKKPLHWQRLLPKLLPFI